MGKDSIYAALKEKFIAGNVPVQLCTSGFLLEGTDLPYSYLSQLSNTLDWKNSLSRRFEHSVYQYTVYTEDYDELNNILDTIENIFNWKTINLNAPRRLTLLEFLGRKSTVSLPQLYHGSVAYSIIIERELNQAGRVTGADLEKCLVNRYKQSHALQQLIPPPVVNDFELETTKQPYFQVKKDDSRIAFLTSKSRIEDTNTTFCFYVEDDLDKLINIIQAVEDVYDNCHLVFPGKIEMIVDWQSNSYMELSPGFWKGEINYNIMLEKEIVRSTSLAPITISILNATFINSDTVDVQYSSNVLAGIFIPNDFLDSNQPANPTIVTQHTSDTIRLTSWNNPIAQNDHLTYLGHAVNIETPQTVNID